MGWAGRAKVEKRYCIQVTAPRRCVTTTSCTIQMSKAQVMQPNLDAQTVEGFGDEWSRFDQSDLSAKESKELFESYFAVFPWESLPLNPSGFDLGCGSGRWAQHVAKRIGNGNLHCIDPSAAIDVARKNLAAFTNCAFHQADVDHIPLNDDSMDFGYSLGVLHHVPDTASGLAACVRKLKPGAPFLLYLYYAFDNRPAWFRAIWKMSDFLRRGVSSLPYGARYIASQVIAILVYWPLSRIAALLEKLGLKVDNLPLAAYRHRSLYVLRTDALDRFGTRLEQRFTHTQIEAMMCASGLTDIEFSTTVPFWCAVGRRDFSSQ